MWRRRWDVIIEVSLLLFLFGLGLGVRLYHITEAPLDFHPTRQLRSALIARGMYYEHLDTMPEWQRTRAVTIWKSEGTIEPQIMERLTAWSYILLGGEYLWVARIYSILFWVLGSAVLYLLAREIAGPPGALLALLFFLLQQYSISASRAFQPDPLMTAIFAAFLWAIYRWKRANAPKWAVLAGVLGGLAILVKAVSLFLILPVWIGILMADQGIRKTLRNPWNWLTGALLLIPYGVYHFYGVYISGALQEQFSLRFFPELWVSLGFYAGWLSIVKQVFGVEYFLLGLLGVFLTKQKTVRVMLAAAWLGYGLMGLAFSHHFSTHDYYQLPFYPIVALGAAIVIGRLVEGVLEPRRWVQIGLLAVFVSGAMVYAWFGLNSIHANNYQAEVQFWTDLGQRLGPEARVIALIEDYGYPLTFWGWVRPSYWFTVSDFRLRELAGQTFDVTQLFTEQIQEKDFFLVTDLEEFDRQPLLRQLLFDQYPIMTQTPDYMLFDLSHSFQTGSTTPSP